MNEDAVSRSTTHRQYDTLAVQHIGSTTHRQHGTIITCSRLHHGNTINKRKDRGSDDSNSDNEHASGLPVGQSTWLRGIQGNGLAGSIAIRISDEHKIQLGSDNKTMHSRSKSILRPDNENLILLSEKIPVEQKHSTTGGLANIII